MQNILERKLAAEFKLLWDLSKKKKINPSLRNELQRHVQGIREEIKDNGIDRLAEKLKRYKNSGRWGEYKMRELAQLIYNNKKPDAIDLGKWVSVEIECIFPCEDAETSFVSFVRKNGFSRFVTIKTDGSIYPDRKDCQCMVDDDGELLEDCSCGSRAFGKELVVTFKYGDWDLIKAVCDKLNEVNATVNKSCGLHVHFDMRHLSKRQVTTLGKRVARTIPALKQLLPKSRQDNRFCNRDINRHSDSPNGESRYSFVNLLSYGRHKTIEFRGHSGTTDAIKIINWIKILRNVMDTRGTNAIHTVSELIQSVKFEADVIGYMVERYKKFSSVAKSNVDDVTQDNSAIFTVAASATLPINVRDVLNDLNAFSSQIMVDQTA